MNKIHVLDAETIDKIAAGEVVERPASVVKELVENAIDAGAKSITVEIKDGGISFIRITDNGSGIPKDQVRTAFLRHATSKIENAEDLSRIASLGFRGEALSSIAAVSQVELITKTKDSLTGTRVILEGGEEKAFEEIGAPEGTTFIIRNLFFNVPVRKKFLKQPATEGGYIIDLMEHLALSRPDISFKFIVGSQVKFYTSGNGELKEVIYRIFGREIAANVIPIDFSENGFAMKGYLGSPSMVRSNRNFEIYFINGRFIRSQILSRAIEEGYKEYLMQHKFPLCVLDITVEDKSQVDVNVHPTKMEVRFSDGPAVYQMITKAIAERLRSKEMIPEAKLPFEKEPVSVQKQPETARKTETVRHPMATWKPESGRQSDQAGKTDSLPQPLSGNVYKSGEHSPVGDLIERYTENARKDAGTYARQSQIPKPSIPSKSVTRVSVPEPFEVKRTESYKVMEEMKYAADQAKQQEFVQETLFEQKILTQENRTRYHIIGQVFDTYWLVQFEDRLLVIDQHAAHEKVKYERLIKHFKEKQVESQNLMPPVIVSLTGQEEQILKEYQETFLAMGFEVEEFGGSEYALRSVPVDLFGCNEKQMFLEVLDELAEMGLRGNLTVVEEKIASMSCKAAVKGNQSISSKEMEELIDELLTLENPYNCPHGRPTIITMSKYEMEKRFKR